MSTLLLLTSALQPSAEVLPGLALLGHHVKILPAEGSALLEAPEQLGQLGDARTKPLFDASTAKQVASESETLQQGSES